MELDAIMKEELKHFSFSELLEILIYVDLTLNLNTEQKQKLVKSHIDMPEIFLMERKYYRGFLDGYKEGCKIHVSRY